MRFIVLFFLISGMLSSCEGSNNTVKNNKKSEAKLQIVSSIKPIQSIVLAIAGKYAHTEQLIPDYASPHNYNFKPSDIRKIKSADVVFRIDEQLESQLNVVFKSLHKKTTLISLADVIGMKLLRAEDLHHEHNEISNSSLDVLENIDFHIWTSPKNAIVIATTVTDILSKLDSKNEKYYQQNFVKFNESLNEESVKISLALTKHQDSAYVVFHNSWQYFADEFGLQKPLVIDLNEGVSSGAKTIRVVQSKIDKENIQCLFYDASVAKSRLKLLAKENVNTSEIDVMAKGIEMNQSTYIHWLSHLAKQVETCLAK